MAKEQKNKQEISIVKATGEPMKKKAFLVEDTHPAIGRILIVDNIKYKVLDDYPDHETGTFIARLTEDDEEEMREYDEALDLLSEKLVKKVDVKRLIKENIKDKNMQELKTGLFILQQEENGEEIEEEHHKGCYHFKIFHKNKCFDFATGSDIGGEIR